MNKTQTIIWEGHTWVLPNEDVRAFIKYWDLWPQWEFGHTIFKGFLFTKEDGSHEIIKADPPIEL